MSESENKDEYLELQKDGESDFKEASGTEPSDTSKQGSTFEPVPSTNQESSGTTQTSSETTQQESGETTTSTSQDNTGSESSGAGEEKQEENNNEGGEEQQQKSSKPGREMENVDAIPTAGGERLGEKHWGESKVVPDVPQKRDENVSSSEGQPDQETRDNTAKNAGGDGGEGEEKQGLLDKIKAKLPIGGSKE